MDSLLIGFALGVTWLQFQAQLPAISLLLAGLLIAGLVSIGLFFCQSKDTAPASNVTMIIMLLMGGFSGAFWADLRASHLMARQLAPAWEGESLSITGVIADLPTEVHQGVRFAFEVETVVPANAVIPKKLSLAWFSHSSFSIQPSSSRDESLEARNLVGEERSGFAENISAVPIPDVHPGERWRFTVKLKRPHGLANPGGFDFEAWMLSQGFRATGVVDERDPPLHLNNVNGFFVQLNRLRDHVRSHIKRILPGNPWVGVMVALVVGDQSQIAPDSWNLFWQTGVGHLISISGLHITMLAGLAASLCKSIHPEMRWVTGVRVLAALAYSLLAGFSIPTQRTLYMIAAASLTPWIHVRLGFAQTLLMALAMALLIDPWAVLEPGFWLSFGAVAALIYGDAHQQRKSAPIQSAIRSQWVATWAMMPLLVLLFQQVSLVAPLANALAIPVVSLGVVPLALMGTVPGLGWLLDLACGLFGWVVFYLQWVSSLLMTVWGPPEPSLGVFMLALGGLVFILGPRGMPGRWVGSMALVPLLLSHRPVPPPGGVWVDVLDVGQGLAMVIRTHRQVMVYDTGPRYSDQNDGGGRVVLPALRSMGIHSLDGLVISHRDTDHSGGADSLVRSMPPGFLLSSLLPGHELLKKVPRSIPCYAGQQWQWDGVSFEILHPAIDQLAEPGRKTNDQGCVLKISAQGHSLLLPADIEARSERELLERNPTNLSAELLIAPHHGSKTSSTPEFIHAVAPKWVIYTVGYRNRFGHPKPEIEARYRSENVPALRTDWDGDIQVRIEKGKVFLDRWRAGHRHYWQDTLTDDF